MYFNEIYFCLNSDLIYMILDNMGLIIDTETSSIWDITSLSCF